MGGGTEGDDAVVWGDDGGWELWADGVQLEGGVLSYGAVVDCMMTGGGWRYGFIRACSATIGKRIVVCFHVQLLSVVVMRWLSTKNLHVVSPSTQVRDQIPCPSTQLTVTPTPIRTIVSNTKQIFSSNNKHI